MDTKASKKQWGRPKKVVDYDHEYIIDFLRLFITDAQSWDDCIGKSVGMNDLIERDVYGKFFELDMLDKLKEVLVVNDFSNLKQNGKIKELKNLIPILRSLAKIKGIDLFIRKKNIHGKKQSVVYFTYFSS